MTKINTFNNDAARMDIAALLADREAMLTQVTPMKGKPTKAKREQHALETAKRNHELDIIGKAAMGQLAVAAFNQTRNEADLIILIRDAGGQGEARGEFIAGHMAATLYRHASDDEGSNLTVAGAIGLARAALLKAGAKSEKPNAHGQRSDTEEAAYTNARQAWSAALKKAGIVSTGKGKGNKNAQKPGETPKVQLDRLDVKPKANTAKDIHEMLRKLATAAMELTKGPALEKDKALVDEFYGALFPEDAA